MNLLPLLGTMTLSENRSCNNKMLHPAATTTTTIVQLPMVLINKVLHMVLNNLVGPERGAPMQTNRWHILVTQHSVAMACLILDPTMPLAIRLLKVYQEEVVQQTHTLHPTLHKAKTPTHNSKNNRHRTMRVVLVECRHQASNSLPATIRGTMMMVLQVVVVVAMRPCRVAKINSTVEASILHLSQKEQRVYHNKSHLTRRWLTAAIR
mmetsp:Transcript_33460/g.49539  ORF Transcript_33460/g.49539 Transcript_33460/m.49539 type:complete len:208 (+) Transcript_33460:640-1263(+)